MYTFTISNNLKQNKMTPLEQYEKTFSKNHTTKRIETPNGITLEIIWNENGTEYTDKIFFDKKGYETTNYSKPYAVDNGII